MQEKKRQSWSRTLRGCRKILCFCSISNTKIWDKKYKIKVEDRICCFFFTAVLRVISGARNDIIKERKNKMSRDNVVSYRHIIPTCNLTSGQIFTCHHTVSHLQLSDQASLPGGGGGD